MCRRIYKGTTAVLRTAIIRNCLLLYGTTFLILLPILCHNTKHSIYFSAWSDQEDGKLALRAENDVRFKHAKDYLNMLQVDSAHDMLHTPNTDMSDPVVTISIITHSRMRHIKDRYKPGYLVQTGSTFLELIHRSRRDFGINIFICNVDSDPDYHKQEAAELSQFIPVVNRFNKLSLPMVHPKEKEKQDYLFCLNSSLDFNAPHVFLVEDDAFPHENALDVLRHVVRSHVGALSVSEPHYTSHRNRTSYIKFYHPERLLGFLSMSPERIPELLSIAACLASLFSIISARFTCSSAANRKDIYKTWLILFMYFVLVSLSIGRTNMLKIRRFLSPSLYSLTPAPSCCTQAILYPRDIASQIVSYMQEKTCDNNYAKDHIIEDFTRSKHLEAFLVQPSVFTHIGLYSALRNQIVDPYLL